MNNNCTAVPYASIGRAASDLLGRDFFTSGVRVEARTLASNGLAFHLTGTRNGATSSSGSASGITGELRTKYTDKARGLTFSESWTSANVLSADIELADALTKGLKLNLATSIHNTENKKNTRIGLEFQKCFFAHKSTIDLNNGPVINLDATATHCGFTVGADTAIKNNKLMKCNFAAGFKNKDYALAVHTNDRLSDFSASFYHAVNGKVEVCGKASSVNSAGLKESKAASVVLEAGAKIKIDNDAFFKVKIDNKGLLGLAYTQSLRPGVKASLGTVIDTIQLSEPVYKAGLLLSFDA